MPWRGPRTRHDPALTSYAWRTEIRGYWKRQLRPCARCGRPIDYEGPRYLPNGRLNPRYLVVGHVVSRYEARARGWGEREIHALSNTQPECQDCSNRSGAKLGRIVQRANRAARRVRQSAEARRW